MRESVRFCIEHMNRNLFMRLIQIQIELKVLVKTYIVHKESLKSNNKIPAKYSNKNTYQSNVIYYNSTCQKNAAN